MTAFSVRVFRRCPLSSDTCKMCSTSIRTSRVIGSLRFTLNAIVVKCWWFVALNRNIPLLDFDAVLVTDVAWVHSPQRSRDVPELRESLTFTRQSYFSVLDMHRHSRLSLSATQMSKTRLKHIWNISVVHKVLLFSIWVFSIKCIYGSCVYLYSIQIYCKIKRANRTRAILFFLAHAALVS